MSDFFELTPILERYPDARYYFLLGGRGTGKTYPAVEQAIKDAIDGKGAFAYVRRLKESICEADMRDLTSPHGLGSSSAWIEDYTDGRYNRVGYYRRYWYLEQWERTESGDLVRVDRNPVPIGRAYSLSTWETDKGSDFGADKNGVKNIIIDEVLSAGGAYLKDEWQMMQQVISTLVRGRWEQDTKIYLLANPVSKYGGPYLKNLGITKKMMSHFGVTEIRYPAEDGAPQMSTIFVYISPAAVIGADTRQTLVYNTFFAFPASKGKSKALTHGYWEMDDAQLLDSGIYNDSSKRRTIYLLFDEEILAVDFCRYTPTGKHYLFVRPAQRVRDKCYFVTLGSTMSKYGIIAFGTHPITDAFNRVYLTHQVYCADLSTADIFHAFMRACKLYSV